ncbi:MAG: hypothetical protein IPP36_02915 [Nitrosomonadales bacterium]|nr:hypothetical protein [Nitrosomonadales bacterium]
MGRLKKGGMAIEEMTATSRLQDLHACLLGVTRLLMDTSKNSDFVTTFLQPFFFQKKIFSPKHHFFPPQLFFSPPFFFRTLLDWMRVNQFIVWDAAQICYLSQL